MFAFLIFAVAISCTMEVKSQMYLDRLGATHNFIVPENVVTNDVIGKFHVWFCRDTIEQLTYDIHQNVYDAYKIDHNTGIISVNNEKVFDIQKDRFDTILIHIKDGSNYESIDTAYVKVIESSNCIFIDPDQSTNGDGSRSNPLNSWNKMDFEPGKAYFQRRNTIYYDGSVYINKSGNANEPIMLGSYGIGFKPVLDGTNHHYNYVKGIKIGNHSSTPRVYVEWIEIYDYDCFNWGDAGIHSADDNKHIKINNCIFRNNGQYDAPGRGRKQPGIYMTGDQNHDHKYIEVNNCISFNNTEHGFKIESAGTKMKNCWAFNNGITSGHGFQLIYGKNKQFEGLLAHGNVNAGISARGISDSYKNCIVYNNWEGVQIWQAGAAVGGDSITFHNIITHNNTNAGILAMQNVSHCSFKNFQSYNNKYGINLRGSVNNFCFTNGMIYGNSMYGVYLNSYPDYIGFENLHFKYLLIYNNQLNFFIDYNLKNLSLNNISFYEENETDIRIKSDVSNVNLTNCIHGNIDGSCDINSSINRIESDPGFVRTTTGNFSLLPSSVAINQGIELGDDEDVYCRKIIGKPDIGAIEYHTNILNEIDSVKKIYCTNDSTSVCLDYLINEKKIRDYNINFEILYGATNPCIFFCDSTSKFVIQEKSSADSCYYKIKCYQGEEFTKIIERVIYFQIDDVLNDGAMDESLLHIPGLKDTLYLTHEKAILSGENLGCIYDSVAVFDKFQYSFSNANTNFLEIDSAGNMWSIKDFYFDTNFFQTDIILTDNENYFDSLTLIIENYALDSAGVSDLKSFEQLMLEDQYKTVYLNQLEDEIISTVLTGGFRSSNLRFQIVGGNKDKLFIINALNGELALSNLSMEELIYTNYTLTIRIYLDNQEENQKFVTYFIDLLKGKSVYINPANINDMEQNGSILKPYSSFDKITWEEGTNYLIKSGTICIIEPMEIDVNNIFIGSYGTGELPIIKTNSTEYIVRAIDKNNITISNLKFSGPHLDNMLYFEGDQGHNISIDGCRFYDGENAIQFIEGRNANVSNCFFKNCNNAIYSQIDDLDVTYNVFNLCNSTIHIIKQSGTATIYNNVFYNNISGLISYDADIRLNNNVFYLEKPGAVAYEIESKSIESNNNLYYPEKYGFITLNGEAYNTLDEIIKNHSIDLNSMVENPMFVDVSNEDFIIDSNSPCIDKGLFVGLNKDYYGTPVPYGGKPDIGIVELTTKRYQHNNDFTTNSGFEFTETEFKVFPNPAMEYINVKFNASNRNSSKMVYLIDMNGRAVLSKQFLSDEIKNECKINLSQITPGHYILQVCVDDKVLMKKIIKN